MDAALDVPARDLVVALEAEATAAGTPPEALARRLYLDLRRLARGHRSRWGGNETMNTTAIVHEAYLKLAAGPGYDGGDHFLCVASRAMRQVLVSYARQRGAAKRGGGAAAVPLQDAPEGALLSDAESTDVVGLDDALARLAAMDPRAGRVVELKVFGGHTLGETAAALGVSQATVTRDWRRARAWLRCELGEAPALSVPRP